jgi:glycosyltransferase involved in cell wall biosynthesis
MTTTPKNSDNDKNNDNDKNCVKSIGMKYPYVILFRYDEHSDIDNLFEINMNKLLCSVYIINNKEDLNIMFNCSYQVLVTYNPDPNNKDIFSDVNSVIGDSMRMQWLHIGEIDIDIDKFNSMVNYCYMSTVTMPHETVRPIFSIFTTCYKSYDKIKRAYDSIKLQKLKHWEWVILDDTPEPDHFTFLTNMFKNDQRIRLYKRSGNSGNIGHVKNEAVSLCRGKYVIELDHDDEILPDVLQDATNVFNNDDEIGFIYMDYINLYENKDNFKYGDFYSLGYAGYYRQKYNNRWVFVACHGNINNITLSHIVSIPNHPRIWRRKTLLEIGNYSEYLPISDDYELFIRTAIKTKIAKIPKLGYIQYMNDGGNNFSYIRNGEINRLRYHLTDHCYKKYNVQEVMKQLNAHEDEKYMYEHVQIWKCDNYDYRYCNKIVNLDYKKQYCIIGIETLHHNMEEIVKLYQDNSNDFIILDNKNSHNSNADFICNELDRLGLSRMKCYEMNDCNDMQLINYFNMVYKSVCNYYIYERIAPIAPNFADSNEKGMGEEKGKGEGEEKEEEKGKREKKGKRVVLITPSIRPNNLIKIRDSIKFEYINKWIIVYDGSKIAENPKLFANDCFSDKIEEHVYKGDGGSGNPQRNYALDLIKDMDTYLYYLDDDNVIHPELYTLLSTLEDNKMYTFDQQRPDNIFPYKTLLKGDNVALYNIDTAMMLIDYNLCRNIRWDAHKYNADGLYITECYEKNKNNWVYIDKTMAFYNPL